jgi:integrase
LEQTKNGERGMIPMNKVVRDAIFSIEKNQQSPYIFCGDDGKPFNFRKAFETALKKAGITNFSFHDLRHRVASHLVMAGIDLKYRKRIDRA